MAQESDKVETARISNSDKLQENLSSFYFSKRFSDVKIVVGESKICAHKVILATCSSYFNSLLTDGDTEIVLDVPLRPFEEILKYIYLGSVSVPSNQNEILDILNLAYKFSLGSLVTFMTAEVASFLTPLTVCHLLNTAILGKLEELKKKCLKFIDQNIEEIRKNDTPLILSQASMINLLERNDFPLPEIDVFTLVEKWCKVNADNDDLVKNCVRLTCLSDNEIIETVFPSNLIEATKLLSALSDIKKGNLTTDQERNVTGRRSSSLTTKVTSSFREVLKSLGLSEETLVEHNASGITAEIKSAIRMENVCSTLNAANSCDLVNLQGVCHEFIDRNFQKLFKNGHFLQLTKESLINFLRCDSCILPDSEQFKIVDKWCKNNNNFDETVIECIQFSLMTVPEIISIVWPSNLLKSEKLLQFIAEIVGVKPKISDDRVVSVLEENVASLNHGAQVTSGCNSDKLLTVTNVEDYCCYHAINGNSNIIVKLHRPFYLNHIKMILFNRNKSYYSYFIEVSRYGKKWLKIIDYSKYRCNSVQDLCFDKQIVRFIKIVGTFCSEGNNLELAHLEAFMKTNIPVQINGIIRPEHNVATLENGTVCIKGNFPENLLNGNPRMMTWHRIGSECIMIQLAQPYIISCIRLLLGWHGYQYRVETSIDKTNWQIAINKINAFYKNWQVDEFCGRPAVFVRIVGISCKDVPQLWCYHFECSSR